MTRRKIFIVAKFEMKTTWKLDDSPVPGMQNANEKKYKFSNLQIMTKLSKKTLKFAIIKCER